LHRHLNEFDFRYNNRQRLGIDDKTRANLAIRNAKGRRLTYAVAKLATAKNWRKLPKLLRWLRLLLDD
jgi:hypothetical protein